MNTDRQWRDLWVKSALCIGGCVVVFGVGSVLNIEPSSDKDGSQATEPVSAAAMHKTENRHETENRHGFESQHGAESRLSVQTVLSAASSPVQDARGEPENPLDTVLLASTGQSTKQFAANRPGDLACTFAPVADSCAAATGQLCEADLEAARIAWKYFENNYQSATGLTNSVNQYTSTTMWDTGSALAATIAARDFELISQKEFDDRVVTLLGTLQSMPLYSNEAPNKVYSTVDASMVDYTNQPSSTGIGVSTLDLARLVSWLNTLSCQHSKYERSARLAIERWNFDRLLADNQMYGLAHDHVSGTGQVLQEGRLGYEQYGGKVFSELGFEQRVSSRYNNRFKQEIDIYGVPVAYDSRDPREFGAYNYVVTESYALDVMEHGHDLENTLLMDNIFTVQKRRWQETGIVTAVSEDNVDRAPWFVYNTIFTAGLPWNTITDTGARHPDLTSVSTKAAFSMALLYPQDPYSDVLMRHIESAYDANNGWYSGVYENGSGYNKAITANTNGIVLSGLLYKKYGAMYEMCESCDRRLVLSQDVYPHRRACGSCNTVLLNSELKH